MRLRFHAIPAVIAITLAVTACGSSPDPEDTPSTQETNVDRPPLAEVLGRHSPTLIEIDGVEAIYEGRTEDGEPCVRIGIAEISRELRDRLPETLEGWPVVIEEIGEIRPMDDES